jgi:osmotically-inducible protein OsmY
MRWLAAFGVGTLVMYFADPDRGALRRGLAREQTLARARRVREQVGRTLADTRQRAAGTLRSMVGRWRGGPVSDTVLGERVRARLGLVYAHADAIDLEVRNGCVILRGAVPRDELATVVRTVKWTPGVRLVDDQLHARATTSVAAPPSNGI